MDENTEESIRKTLDNHKPIILGKALVYGALDDRFYSLWLDYSKFSGIALDVFTNSHQIHRVKIPPAYPKRFPIRQGLFNMLFSKEKIIPQVINIADDMSFEDFPVRIVGHIYPIVTLSNTTLHKIDLSIFGNMDGKEVIFNSIHKHFLAKKSKKDFQKQAEKALKKCFFVMKQAFLDTKERKVYVGSNKTAGAAYKTPEMR